MTRIHDVERPIKVVDDIEGVETEDFDESCPTDQLRPIRSLGENDAKPEGL